MALAILLGLGLVVAICWLVFMLCVMPLLERWADEGSKGADSQESPSE